jgi:molybdopterin-guanine dinucleotide biosynthesis protein A
MNTRFNGDITIAGAILAGGRASRFDGRPKGLLRLPDGRTFVAKMLAEMRGAGLATVVVSANEKEPYVDLGVPVVSDLTPSIGPLGGIEAVLAFCRKSAGAVLFVPCDLPGLTRHDIRFLLDGFQRRPLGILSAETADGIRHPLCSVVPVDLLDRISEAVRNGHLSIRRLWKEIGSGVVRFECPDRFCNINSPADYGNLFGAPTSPAPFGDAAPPLE